MKTLLQLRFTVLSTMVLSIAFRVNAQEFLWANQYGSPSNDRAEAITVDDAGNIYTVGAFGDVCNFSPNTTNQTLTSAGGFDIFLTKTNPFGELIWVKQFGSEENDIPYCVALDEQNNIYIGGGFSGTVQFNPSDENSTITLAGNTDGFILKLDESGNFLWVKSISGSGFENVFNIQFEPSTQTLYATGNFSSTVDFNPDVALLEIPSQGGFDAFVMKLNAEGEFLWAKTFGAAENDNCFDFILDPNGDLILCGIFNGTVDFNPGDSNATLISGGGTDGYVLKMDSNGNFIWVKHVVNSLSNDDTRSVQSDLDGNIYCAGYFSGTSDFNPGVEVESRSPSAAEEVYISKMNASGEFQWVISYQGESSGFSNLTEMRIDNYGNLYTVGIFNETVDFNDGNEENTITSSIGNDIFICKQDLDGNFEWVKQIGSPNTIENAHGLLLKGNNGIYLCGSFNGTVDFNPYEGETNLTTFGNNDIFLMKLCNSDLINVAVTACNTFVSPSGMNIWDESGIYTENLMNEAGCDSTIIIDLTIVDFEPTIDATASSLNASISNASYQWIDCETSTPIEGADSQSFSPFETGEYAVIITLNECTDTTTCENFTLINVEDLLNTSQTTIYPNPINNNEVNIQLDKKYESIQASIFDSTGKTVQNVRLNATDTFKIHIQLPPSAYYIQLKCDDAPTSTFKLIVQ